MKKLITVRAEPDVRETIKAIGRSEYYKAAVELMEKSKQLGLVPENALGSTAIVKKEEKPVGQHVGCDTAKMAADRIELYKRQAMESAEAQAKVEADRDYWKDRFQKAVDAYPDAQVGYWRSMAKRWFKQLQDNDIEPLT